MITVTVEQSIFNHCDENGNLREIEVGNWVIKERPYYKDRVNYYKFFELINKKYDEKSTTFIVDREYDIGLNLSQYPLFLRAKIRNLVKDIKA